jgi:MFS family permease
MRTGDRTKPLLQNPAWRVWLAAAFTARLPATMLPVALVLSVHAATGSFVSSGLISGASALTSAACAPWRGRQLDRQVLPRALSVSMLGATAGVAAMAAAIMAAAPVAVLLLITVAASLLAAGVGGAYRSLLPGFLPHDQIPRAYMVDGVGVMLVWISGPALVGVVAAMASPQATMVAVAAAAGSATLLSCKLPRRSRRERAFVPSVPGLIIRLWVPLLLNMAIGFNLGALQISLPALLGRGGNPADAGLLIAALFGASAIGATAYTMAWARRPGRKGTRAHAAALIMVCGLATTGAAVSSLWPAIAALLIAGLALGPGDSMISLLVPEQVPAAQQAESFGYMSTFGYAGTGVANAVTGLVIARSGAGAGLLIAGLAPVLAAVAVLISRADRDSDEVERYHGPFGI